MKGKGKSKRGVDLMATSLIRNFDIRRDSFISMPVTASGSAAGLMLVLGIYEWMLDQ